MPPRKRNNRGDRLHHCILDGHGHLRKTYDSKQHRLLLAIDIGTTFSAASFCLLKPQEVPAPEAVSNWPGQTVPDIKVPTILYYDQSGNLQLRGADAMVEDNIAKAKKEQWNRVEWFKLALRPSFLSPLSSGGAALSQPDSSDIDHANLPALPASVSIEKAYTDFLRLMLEYTEHFFCKHRSSGKQIWGELFSTMNLIFTIPNGWELRQQHLIRTAAVDAGFLNLALTSGDMTQDVLPLERIHFVPEAEAAMIYAADSGHVDSWLNVGNEVILCDAGGGTIDITAYKITQEFPLELKEILAPKCIVAGAVFIDQQARHYIQSKLTGTTWDTQEKMEELVAFFERDTKKRFGRLDHSYGLGYAAGGNNIPQANICDGRLYIPGADVASFFEPTLSAIKTAIDEMCQKLAQPIKNVIMVGGLMNSDYAFKNLEKWGREKDLKFSKPDGSMAKAVSNGALLWYLTRPVTSHIAKFHYGTDVSLPVDECKLHFSGRKFTTRADGVRVVPNIWSTIAERDGQLEPGKPAMGDFETYLTDEDIIEVPEFREKIFICRKDVRPDFTTEQVGGVKIIHPDVDHACSIVLDLKSIFDDTRYEDKKSKDGKRYKILRFTICIINDGCNIKAYARWRARNKTRQGDAKIVHV